MHDLTERQQREIEYHKTHAISVANAYQSVDFDVITSTRRRWWNAYWDIWTFMLGLHLKGKTVLVVGCGAGEDALRFAKAGAAVFAFDLSSEMLAHGIRLAEQYRLPVQFAVMPCEQMAYPEDFFDIVFARDILHHVDIPQTMNEVARVSKPNALFIVDEIYSHSITDLVRQSALVKRVLYPKMQKFVYGHESPYITMDERKMTEKDIAIVNSFCERVIYRKFFNFLVTRIVPERYSTINILDRILLIFLGPFACVVAGRIVQCGQLKDYLQQGQCVKGVT